MNEALKCLNFLKDEAINDIACLKDSITTKTLYQLYFTNFDTIEQALLKTQKMEEENKQLEKELGCPLDVLAKLMLNGFYYEYPEYDDNDEPTGKMELIYDRFVGMTYLVRGTDKNIYIDTLYLEEALKLSDYKKTWWLKEDKEMIE